MTDFRISELTLRNFRNYEEFYLKDIGNLTIYIGKNGVGKTNVLEGIQLLTSCHSFRNAQAAQLVREGEEQAFLHMLCGDGNRSISVDLQIEPGKKRYQVNGKAKAVADVKGMLPAVCFTPDDLSLVKRSSSVKRDMLDNLGNQLSRNYYIVQRDYEKILRYKNRLMKDESSLTLIQSANDTMVLCGVQLHCFRLSLFNRILPLAQEYYAQISHSNEAFTAQYCPSWIRYGTQEEQQAFSLMEHEDVPSKTAVQEAMYSALEKHLDEEMRRCRSLIGPHADLITFFLGGKDASQFASQGQQRSIVLAWKLAEVETVNRSLGTKPVLLLDDVMSELDEARREELVGFMTDEIQTFITATDLSGFNENLISRAQIVSLP